MRTARITSLVLSVAVLSAIGCGSSGDDDASKPAAGSGGTTGGSGAVTGGSGGSMGGSGGTGDTGGNSGEATGGSGTPKGGTSGSGGSKGGTSNVGGSGGTSTPVVPGEPCNSVESALPSKPCMVNVGVKVRGNSAEIEFDPIDGAADYRVYELPADDDITVKGDALTIKNAVYRCAGTRMTPPAQVDGEPSIPGGGIHTMVDGQDVYGYTRKEAEATLGYVSAVPGDGLVPVYALGDSDKDADNSCYFMRWQESRTKQYVTSESDRDDLLGRSSRDDGIAFYVPAEAGSGTQPIYTGIDGNKNRYYYGDGPEAAKRDKAGTAFNVFAEPGDDLVPLMRVFYQNACGHSHDELVAGKPRFDRARKQGDASPQTVLHWSGFSGATTLVVEALADGCPNNLPGLLAPISDPVFTDEFGNKRPAWISFEDAKALSPAGEVYVNGQFDAKNNPRPIARSFVKVKPADPTGLDWFEGFDSNESIGTPEELDCGAPSGMCGFEFRESTDFGETHFLSAEEHRHVYQSLFGELWVMYDDVAADTPGKFRLTAGKMGEISDDKYLYATMEVNAFTTSRRYPQFIISDQPGPVQWNLANGSSLVIQTFGEWPYVYEVEYCDHRPWDVNNQCPRADLYHVYEAGSTDSVKSLLPNAEVGDRTGVDRATHFEIWVSSKRIYTYLDGQPYGCVNLPTSGAPGPGPASVTFGDTLYHSGVDNLEWYTYMKENWQYDTRRHFDNLGFKSGVAAPAWDDSRFPCTSTFKE
jgi:hypothetical protein